MEFITNRTAADVRIAKSLEAIEWQNMTEAQKNQWRGQLKGRYTYKDLNRVESAVGELANLLKAEGYEIELATKTDWTDEDFPDWDRYFLNVSNLCRIAGVEPPPIPYGVSGINYQAANNVERALQMVYEKITGESVEADYYLYGTPSDSGNVAIAEGDGYVVYEGRVLPPLPEWDKETYPYAMIYIDVYGSVIFHALNVRPYYNGKNLTVAAHKYVSSAISDDATWVDVFYRDGLSTTSHIIPFWTDFDLLAEDGSTYQPKADPIPLASNEPIRYEGDIPVYEQKE